MVSLSRLRRVCSQTLLLVGCVLTQVCPALPLWGAPALDLSGVLLPLLEEKARRGDPLVLRSLGIHHLRGLGTPRNPKEALRCFLLAQEGGDPVGRAFAGFAFQEGWDAPRDEAKARERFEGLRGILLPLAQKGDPEAQVVLGRLFHQGLGGAKQAKEAARWFRAAAQQKDPEAQLLLGQLLVAGRGLPRDLQEGTLWIRRSVEQGYMEGQAALGRLYVSGVGVPRNDGEALWWLRRAADQGSPSGQHARGLLFLQGRGVPRCESEGAAWIRLAALQGAPAAQGELGVLYYCGRGVEEDLEEASLWFERAAEGGDPLAQSYLGTLYGYG